MLKEKFYPYYLNHYHISLEGIYNEALKHLKINEEFQALLNESDYLLLNTDATQDFIIQAEKIELVQRIKRTMERITNENLLDFILNEIIFLYEKAITFYLNEKYNVDNTEIRFVKF